MSTNYYWHVDGGTYRNVTLPTGKEYFFGPDAMDPDIHIGKRSGRESGLHFSWAQNRGDVLDLCTRHPGQHIVEDEYGEPLTGAEFVVIIQGCVTESEEMVGKYFT